MSSGSANRLRGRPARDTLGSPMPRESAFSSEATKSSRLNLCAALVGALVFYATSPAIAQMLSGTSSVLHEGGFVGASSPLLSAPNQAVHLHRGTLGELAPGVSAGTGLQLRGGVLQAVAADSDGDGLSDLAEAGPDGLVGPGETDPSLPDTDGDNWDDGTELALGTDPTNQAVSPGVGDGKFSFPSALPGGTQGDSVAISGSGDTAIVGAPQETNEAGFIAGAAYVVTRSPAGSWSIQEKLILPMQHRAGASDPVQFGDAVALSQDGNTAAIGAILDSPTGQPADVGAVYIFVRTGIEWSFQAKLVAPEELQDAVGRLGFSVALSDDGNTAIAGAIYDDVGTDTNAGAAYVFSRTGTSWELSSRLISPSRSPHDEMGWSVALSSSGETAIVGVARDDLDGADPATCAGDPLAPECNVGSAYVFSRNGDGTWNTSSPTRLLPPVGAVTDRFGHSVALSSNGALAIVGSSQGADGARAPLGSADVFVLSNGSWVHEERLESPTPGRVGHVDQFGYSVALSSSGQMAVVGAQLDDPDSGVDAGSAYVFSRIDGAWVFQRRLLAADGAAFDQFGYSVSVSDSGATALVGARLDDTTAGADAGSAYLFDLTDTDGDRQIDAADPDDDNDGLSDDFELTYGFDPLVPGEQNEDPDQDGLNNLAEQAAGTNPHSTDTDDDGLLDAVETNDGVFRDPLNTGTDPLNPDTDNDQISDGKDLSPLNSLDCRSKNPELVVVWGIDAPFGVEYQPSDLLNDRYLLNDEVELPGLSADLFPANFAEELGQGLENIFTNARNSVSGLPATTNGLRVTTHADPTIPLPSIGQPGSPSLLYVVDKGEILAETPDFGGLGGFAKTGVNRFNRSCNGGEATVFIDPAEVPTDMAVVPNVLIERAAHEAGHLYGMRHVLPDHEVLCSTLNRHAASSAVMDYVEDGDSAQIVNCPEGGCEVVEPPDCSGEPTGGTHNPLYHYLRYVIGDSDESLRAAGVSGGSWDEETKPIVIWQISFNFNCTSCADIKIYNLRILETLPSGAERVIWPVPSAINNQKLKAFGDNAYPDVSLAQLNQIIITIPHTSGIKLLGSATEPGSCMSNTQCPAPPTNIHLVTKKTSQAPFYPPPETPPGEPQPPTKVVIHPTLIEVDPIPDTEPQEFTSDVFAEGPIVSAKFSEPLYEARHDGLYEIDPTDPSASKLVVETPFPGPPPGRVTANSTASAFPNKDTLSGEPGLPADTESMSVVPEPTGSVVFMTALGALVALARRRKDRHSVATTDHDIALPARRSHHRPAPRHTRCLRSDARKDRSQHWLLHILALVLVFNAANESHSHVATHALYQGQLHDRSGMHLSPPFILALRTRDTDTADGSSDNREHPTDISDSSRSFTEKAS